MYYSVPHSYSVSPFNFLVATSTYRQKSFLNKFICNVTSKREKFDRVKRIFVIYSSYVLNEYIVCLNFNIAFRIVFHRSIDIIRKITTISDTFKSNTLIVIIAITFKKSIRCWFSLPTSSILWTILWLSDDTSIHNVCYGLWKQRSFKITKTWLPKYGNPRGCHRSYRQCENQQRVWISRRVRVRRHRGRQRPRDALRRELSAPSGRVSCSWSSPAGRTGGRYRLVTSSNSLLVVVIGITFGRAEL